MDKGAYERLELIAGRQQQVWTRADARGCGLSDATVNGRSSTWATVQRGVYRWPGATASYQQRARAALLAAGLSPEPQLLVHDAQGHPIARLDLGFRQARLGVEADGAGPHGQPKAVYTDRWRHNALQSEGWLVLRFTWHDARRRPAYIRSAVLAALAERGGRVA